MFTFLSTSFIAYADPCDPVALGNKLSSLGIAPETHRRKELLEILSERYGVEFKERIIKEHSIFDVDFSLSIDDVDWLLKQVDELGYARYYYSPFMDNFDTITLEMFQLYNSGIPGNKALFFSQVHFNKFSDLLSKNRDVISMMYANDHNLPLNVVQEKFDLFAEKIKSEAKILYQSEIQNKPVIHIVGHGDAGDDVIYSGTGSKKYSMDIVEDLKKMGVPNESTIKLDFCWSACGSRPTELKIEEALSAINEGKFDDVFGDIEESFYFDFISELKDRMPDFSGNIVGYRGTVMTALQEGVLSLDGSKKKLYAVELTMEDGKILFNKDEMKVVTNIMDE